MGFCRCGICDVDLPDGDWYTHRKTKQHQDKLRELGFIKEAKRTHATETGDDSCQDCGLPLPDGGNLCAACGHKREVLAAEDTDVGPNEARHWEDDPGLDLEGE